VRAARMRSALEAAPAPWFVTGLGTAAALIAAFGHLTTAEAAVIFSLATAIGTVITASLTRPVPVSVISGAAAVILGDFTLFGLHLNSDETGAVVGLVTFALGAFLHLAHVQYLAARPVPVTMATASVPPPVYRD
jgi:hypothetical protein